MLQGGGWNPVCFQSHPCEVGHRWTLSPGPQLMKTHVFQGDQLVPACLKQLRICSLALVPVGVAGNFHNVATEDGYAPFHLQRKILNCLNLPEREFSLSHAQQCGWEGLQNRETILPLFVQRQRLCLVSNATAHEMISPQVEASSATSFHGCK